MEYCESVLIIRGFVENGAVSKTRRMAWRIAMDKYSLK
jgi:hypothetical protein